MGWFNWLVLAEEIAEPEEGDGEKISDKRAPGFCGVSKDEWEAAAHAGRVDASCDGELQERVENKKKKGLAWWF
jgi:hypothetical protein